MRACTLATLAAAFASTAMAIDTISVKGNAFFAGDKRFYIRGVDYQPGGASEVQDPLADAANCKRDIPVFKELGINTIRIYTVDNSADHSECMKELEAAGIYLILDVNTPLISINRDDPESTYNAAYLQHVFATIDVFSKYDNTLGFFSANEVVNAPNNTAAATYVKAVTRDMRTYIKKRLNRAIPVGYSAADVEENRKEMAAYLNCGDDELARSDFFAFNDYSWCGKSDFKTSGWDKKVDTYKDYSIPLFLSEFGCIDPPGRRFDEVEAMYSDKMTSVFSGGLVYEYSLEPNNYGLVEISDDGKSVKKLKDFNSLKSKYSSVKMPSGDGGYKKSGKPSTCPSKSKGKWEAENDLPPMPSDAKKYLEQGAGTPKGIKTSTAGASTSKSKSSSSSSSGSSTSDSAAASGSSAPDSAAASMSLSSVMFSCVVGASTIAAAMFAL